MDMELREYKSKIEELKEDLREVCEGELDRLAIRGGELIKEELAARAEKAMKHYHKMYDNEAYKAATVHRGTDADRHNALIDSALAICGHPRFTYHAYEWDTRELVFLFLFI